MNTIFISKPVNKKQRIFDRKPSASSLEKMDRPTTKHTFLEDPYDTIEEFDYDEMKQETRRLATYQNWPKDSPVKPIDLAAAGFFYLGKEDSVKCFSCEVHLKQWVAGDNPFNEHKNHKPNCDFVKTFEKPSLALATSTGPVLPSPVITSPLNGPHSPQVDHPSPLHNVVHTSLIDPMRQHIEYPPSHYMHHEQPVTVLHPPSAQHCNQRYPEQPGTLGHPLISHHYPEHQPLSLSMQQPIQATSHPPDHLQLPYPAGPYITPEQYVPSRSNSLPGYRTFSPQNEYRLTPEEPLSHSWPQPVADDYSDYNARILSYKHWPPDAILRPTELTQAGFYYTGHEDGVTCYKCKVSLKGWEPNDTPWGEHKKWSPNCPLVLEHYHGVRQPTPSESNESFVIPGANRQLPLSGQPIPTTQRHSSLPVVTGIRRPVTQYSHLISPQELQLGNIALPPSQNVSPGSVPSTRPQPVQTVSPTAAPQIGESANLTQRDLERVYDMGFSQQEVKDVFEAQAVNAGTSFNNIDDLIQALLYHQGFKEQRRKNSGNKKGHDSGGSASCETSQSNPSTSAAGDTSKDNMQRELERMQEARLCKVCMDADVGVVFLPCGHLVCCPDCAVGMKLCPMCRGDITETIRTYFS